VVERGGLDAVQHLAFGPKNDSLPWQFLVEGDDNSSSQRFAIVVVARTDLR